MKTAGVYRIDLGNGNFYIGSAVNLKGRESSHRTGLMAVRHDNPRMQNVWNKYGIFEFTVLEECDKKDLLVREQVYLNRHFKNRNNVNLAPTAGNTLGYRHSAESLAKMSVAHKNISDETRAKLSAAQMGKTHSAEHCANISAGTKGRVKSAEHCAKISVANKGRVKSAETCAKLSVVAKARHASVRLQKIMEESDEQKEAC